MQRVLILGAGMVTGPMVDYMLDQCNYQVIMATRTTSKAAKIIRGRPNASMVEWTTDNLELLDSLVAENDLVVSMLPPTLHLPVAEACLKHRKNMVTTSYLSPGMVALDTLAKKQEIIILNEIGEDPGIDHMGAKRMIDEVHREGGVILSLTSYGAGLPSFEHNRNPFGYKFSWSPNGVLMAARTSAAYLKNGAKVTVPADELFNHHWLVDIDELGTFETYPNRDCTGYRKYFGLGEKVSLYRGLLRFTGWCNTLSNLKKLKLLDDHDVNDYQGRTYREFSAALVGSGEAENVAGEMARFLELKDNDDIINRLKWLGLFDDRMISPDRGTNADLLVKLMLDKMSYRSHEKDMIIVHDEIIARIDGRYEKRTSIMMVEGIPHGDSAMSRAVSLPAAIASKHILEKKIAVKGVHIPVLPEIYGPVLDELARYGYVFKHERTEIVIENLGKGELILRL